MLLLLLLLFLLLLLLLLFLFLLLLLLLLLGAIIIDSLNMTHWIFVDSLGRNTPTRGR